jgi:transposase-like protein
VTDLTRRLERAEMERDILKKATAFFASQNQ